MAIQKDLGMKDNEFCFYTVINLVMLYLPLICNSIFLR